MKCGEIYTHLVDLKGVKVLPVLITEVNGLEVTCVPISNSTWETYIVSIPNQLDNPGCRLDLPRHSFAICTEPRTFTVKSFKKCRFLGCISGHLLTIVKQQIQSVKADKACRIPKHEKTIDERGIPPWYFSRTRTLEKGTSCTSLKR